jgi:DNA end-binding protein Ku
MPPCASWKGFLRMSLVTCPIALYPATTSSARISFNRINRTTGARVRQLNVDGRTGEKVENEDIVRGYEIDRDRYVILEDEEIEAIQVEASKVIDVAQFVDAGEVDPFFLDTPFYLAPEGEVGEETYRVITCGRRDGWHWQHRAVEPAAAGAAGAKGARHRHDHPAHGPGGGFR